MIKFFSSLFLLSILVADIAVSQFSYVDTPAIEVLNDVQNKSNIRFLYREALISQISMSFNSSREEIIQNLINQLEIHNITLSGDPNGNQFIIIRQLQSNQPREKAITIRGQVVNDRTGDRLPFSTLSWHENDQLKGVSASSAGIFHIQTDVPESTFTFSASFVGYQRETITLPLKDNNHFEDLTVRLTAQQISGKEIVVVGSNFYSSGDSLLAGLIRTDRFSPLGDGNVVRALQVHPAVQPAVAINDGLSIRGSAPDGFHLELDGMMIFNQSHLFGLLDSFNDDAVKNSGFYYGIAPANISTPSGGLLSLITKNGSINHTQYSAAISNTSFRTTLEGPIRKGRSSWFLASRISTMSEIDWLNNDNLIQLGLDINRPNSLSENGQDTNHILVTPKQSEVTFYDFHGKLYFEGIDGSRTMISSYFGGDQTSHIADRTISTRSLRDRFSNVEMTTTNNWNNFAGSVQHQRELMRRIYSHSSLGLSAYETSFAKDDFIYTDTFRSGNTNQTIVFTSPLSNKSTMNRVKASQMFDIDLNGAFLKTGLEGIYHRSEYLEESFDRPLFYSLTASFQTDLYGHIDWQIFHDISISTGVRTHYFSNGRYLKTSPRFKIVLFPDRRITLNAGYSKNYQFVNRLSFSNAVSADLWVLANSKQPPTSSEQVSTGIYIQPAKSLHFQVEIYQNFLKNLRIHELNTYTLANSLEVTPWFYQNSGTAKGVEAIGRYSHPYFDLTQTYTLSSIELQNDLLNNGDNFLAPWDRTHSLSTQLEIKFHHSLSLFGSYTATSGVIPFLLNSDLTEESRLPDYHRLDLSVLFTNSFRDNSLSINFSLFNAMNRKNIWYREIQPVISTLQAIPFIRPEAVDVYDLGIQPSFEVKFSF